MSNGPGVPSVTGGTGPYTYMWNNSETQYIIDVNPVDTMIYSVFAVDANGCFSDTVYSQVNVRPPLSITAVGDGDLLAYIL